MALQGNLDPLTLLTDPATIEREATAIVRAAGPAPGHIFNLGHGIVQQTPPEHVGVLVETVHRESRALRQASRATDFRVFLTPVLDKRRGPEFSGAYLCTSVVKGPAAAPAQAIKGMGSQLPDFKLDKIYDRFAADRRSAPSGASSGLRRERSLTHKVIHSGCVLFFGS